MYNPFKNIEEYKELALLLKRGAGLFALGGCSESEDAMLSFELSRDYNKTIIICSDEKKAYRMQRDCLNFAKDVFMYPAKDLLFYDADIQGNLIAAERIKVLRHLIEDERTMVITTIDGLMDKISSGENIKDEALRLYEGMVISEDSVKKILVRLGYERAVQVENSGQFSVRGGILDIYPLTETEPVRIEFFDDEIDTIRSFDPESQRSVERMEEITVYPAIDSAKDSGAGVSLLDYFGDDSLLILSEPYRLKERAEAVEAEFRESMSMRLEKGYTDSENADLIFSSEEVFAKISGRRGLLLTASGDSLKGFDIKKCFDIQAVPVSSYKDSFELLIKDLTSFKKNKNRVTLLTPSRTRMSRLAENLRSYGLSAYCPDEGAELLPGTIEVVWGNLKKGFELPDSKYVLITEGDMFGSLGTKKKRRKKKFEGAEITGLNELSIGDYVVHESHGIGIYRGIERITRDGAEKDYIKIEYADGGNLYLPATRLNAVQKYSGKDAVKPKLNRLNSPEWKKTKERVRGKVKDIAKELIELYASRQSARGFKYSEDTVWQKEFEEMFPYEETEDQLSAIEATKEDMESGKVMDRLICGDVGYGKTEIALRAAFKAVQDGKQVAYLVPTTILAKQHYNTFVDRMDSFPVKIDLMCRFKSAAENRDTAKALKNGTVDIVIGTHRLLSDDVNFKNLGLLIIDEEQRFGVGHKEKIKRLKNNVDVLTLTATPIPRTLHMSLAGIRDLSILEEPPVDRVPIQTYVMEYNDEAVREAIERELQRGGQVYYVYNRVKDIEDKTARVKSLVPDAEVDFAHGQMPERELEDIMMRFIEGETDVLVSTTIIETGLDIPNANTIIIDGAERMGLSQLYQIRGRVGRSSRNSYAFLMYKKDKILSEEAEKRLTAIREFTRLGSGIRIAMRDLEIRGAGNVLGAEQHGFMEAVGYDLYCKLLNQAVKLLKGETAKEEEFETAVDCDMDAFIPDSYIGNEFQKLDTYKKIAGLSSEEEFLDMEDELLDRFGDIPKEVTGLIRLAKLKLLAHKAYMTEVVIKKDSIRIMMYPQADINVNAIPELIENERGKLKFIRGKDPKFVYKDTKPHSDCEAMLKKAEEIIGKLMKEG